MSQFFVESAASPPPPGVVAFIEGNDSIPVPPNGSDIIFLLGNNSQGINITGNAATHTVTVNASPITIIGGIGINVSGSPVSLGGTVTLTLAEIVPAYTNVTHGMSPYSVNPLTDYFISVDATAGAVTIILPPLPSTNQQFVIKDRLGQANTNNITVESSAGVTVDGQVSYVFSDNYESLECLFHGTNYEGF